MNQHVVLAVKSLVLLVCLVGLWQALVSFYHVPAYILPGPLVVVSALRDRYPSLLNSLWITTEEAAGGLLASIVVGVGVAMVFAQWRWLRQVAYPYTILLQTVPIVAIAPLVILWIGAGIPAVMVVTFIICLAYHCQYHARADQRRRESHSPVHDAQRDTGAGSVQAAIAQRPAQSLYRHSYLGRHQCYRRTYRGAFRGLDAGGRGRTRVGDYLCQ